MVYFREQERGRERAQEHAHARETTHECKRRPRSCTCPATTRGKYDRSVGPRVRMEFGISLVPWIETSLDRLKAKSKAEKIKGSRTPHVACMHALSHTLSFRLSEVPARSAQEVLPSNM